MLSAEVEGEQLFAAVSVPSWHERMPNHQGSLPELIVLEILRQCGYLMAHSALGMPGDWHLVTTALALEWRATPPTVRADVDFTCTVTGRVREGDGGHLAFHAELLSHGDMIATGELEARCLAPRHYAAIRGFAERASRSHANLDAPTHDGVSGPGRPVRWNDQDRFLFNRRGDHVVSMALVDAVLADAASSSTSGNVSIRMEFLRFAEQSAAILLERETLGTIGQDLWLLRQAGQVIARAVTRPVV